MKNRRKTMDNIRKNEIPLLFKEQFVKEYIESESALELFNLHDIALRIGTHKIGELRMTVQDFEAIFNRDKELFRTGKINEISYKEVSFANMWKLLNAIGNLDQNNQRHKITFAKAKNLIDSVLRIFKSDSLVVPLEPESTYFAIPSNRFMILLLPLFSGHTKRIPKGLAEKGMSADEAKAYVNSVFKKEQTTKIVDRIQKEVTQTIAIIADTPRIKAHGTSETLFQDIESKELELAIMLKQTFGAVGIKHFLGYLIAMDENNRTGNFIFDVNKHLKIIGKENNAKARIEALQILEILNNLSIEVQNTSQNKPERKMFRLFTPEAEFETSENGIKNQKYSIRASEVWYSNSFESLNGKSQQYAKLLKKVAKEPAKEHSITLYLTPLFALFWRINNGDESIDWTLNNLLEWTNQTMDERNKGQKINTFIKELNYMVEQGYLGEWKTKSGKELSHTDLNEVISFYPSEEMKSQIEGISTKRIQYKEKALAKIKAKESKEILFSIEDFNHLLKNTTLTQAELAHKLEISATYLSLIKSGKKFINPTLSAKLWALKSELDLS